MGSVGDRVLTRENESFPGMGGRDGFVAMQIYYCHRPVSLKKVKMIDFVMCILPQ